MIFFADWLKLVVEYWKEVVKRKLGGLRFECLNISKSLYSDGLLRRLSKFSPTVVSFNVKFCIRLRNVQSLDLSDRCVTFLRLLFDLVLLVFVLLVDVFVVVHVGVVRKFPLCESCLLILDWNIIEVGILNHVYRETIFRGSLRFLCVITFIW